MQGTATYVNLLWEDESAASALEPAASDLADFCLALGGTVSGEHGIGTLKTSFLTREPAKRSSSFSGRFGISGIRGASSIRGRSSSAEL